MKSLSYALIALNICLIFPVITQAQTSGALVSVDAMSTGVVKKIDVQQGKVTINHGPLLNLDMPAMTMVFRVADSKLLDNLKADDKIRFIANKKDGALTIVRLEQVNSPAVNIQSSVPTPPSNPVVTSVPINNRSVQTPVIQAISTTATSTMNPADSTASVANPVYKSAFDNYQPWREITDAPGQNWRAANDEMGRLGGHAGQLRDAPSAQITPSVQPAEPTMSMDKDVKIKQPAPKHDMNNMNQGK
jgi:Cu(I)/Ag(I) efflux system protein CusF